MGRERGWRWAGKGRRGIDREKEREEERKTQEVFL